MAAAPKVRCPICKKEVAYDDPNMPFCSDRCRIIDLGNWAAEKYVISTPALQSEIERQEPAPERPEKPQQ